MGLRFRRSARLGPFRINLSTSGVGYSVGGPGFRTGVRPNGRRYSSVGVPGTGLSYFVNHPQQGEPAGCLSVIAFVAVTCGATASALIRALP